jgi:hypothetical protein
MKNCPVCTNVLSDSAKFCPVCTTDQNMLPEKQEADYNSIFLKVLCILTIIGSTFGLISIPVSLSLGHEYEVEALSGSIIGLTMGVALVKLAAAIMMLKKKLLGLHIYTGAAIMGLAYDVYMLIAFKLGDMTGLLSGVLDIGVILIFLIMYWLPVNRRLLS